VITIIQKDGNGGVVQQDLDLKRLLPGGDAAHIRLGYDDIVFVPPLPVFYIYGEVRQPGAYPIAPEMTVRQALSVGGGLTVRGTERGISMERKGKNGEVTTRRPRLTDRVQPNDVLRVPEGWF
jgi:polysaccharide export outer membrane protein